MYKILKIQYYIIILIIIISLLNIFPGLTVRWIVVNVCAASLGVLDLVEQIDKRSSSPDTSEHGPSEPGPSEPGPSEPGPTDVGGGNSYAYSKLPGLTFCSSTIIIYKKIHIIMIHKNANK